MNKNEVPAYFDDAEIADIEDVAILENLTPQQVVEIATKEYLLSRKTGSNAVLLLVLFWKTANDFLVTEKLLAIKNLVS